VDITFATDNRLAGKLDGEWAASTLDGKAATIALLDLFNDKIVSVDYDRDQGFLEGMGIDVADPKKNGDEAKTGKYTGGKGGDYTIVCNEPSNGAEDGGRTAMENCLSKNPAINVVYTINEPAAVGASTALKAAGVTDALIVSVDGGCAGVASVKNGTIGATAQQYPLKMATLGMEAIAKIARGGEKPTTSEGLEFFNTGVALVTDKPAAGVDSITTDEALKICWG
ncbi:MAG TPA: substrate-binding domain-containing protein, partial [Jiangellaceae bacterium]|nr:substrate-binding domain-containing protein [Jiangellaceae bacterium]